MHSNDWLFISDAAVRMYEYEAASTLRYLTVKCGEKAGFDLLGLLCCTTIILRRCLSIAHHVNADLVFSLY